MTDPKPIAANVTPIAVAVPRPAILPHAVATPALTRSVSARFRDAIVRAIPLGLYHLVRVGPAGIAGVTATVAALVIAATALVASRNAADALAAKVASAQHHSNLTSNPEEGVRKVVSSLPTRDQIPAVMGVMLQQAQQSGIALDTGHYSYSPPKGGGVGRYEIEFPVKAEYPNVRDFINRTLTAVPSAGLDKLRIERKLVGDSVVSADVRFVVFVRSEPAP